MAPCLFSRSATHSRSTLDPGALTHVVLNDVLKRPAVLLKSVSLTAKIPFNVPSVSLVSEPTVKFSESPVAQTCTSVAVMPSKLIVGIEIVPVAGLASQAELSTHVKVSSDEPVPTENCKTACAGAESAMTAPPVAKTDRSKRDSAFMMRTPCFDPAEL